MKTRTGTKLAKQLKISKTRGLQAVMKAELLSAVINAVDKQNLTHAVLADRSSLSRSTVTGLLSGSLQKVTIDRILKLVEAVGLVAEIKVKKAA